MKPLDYDNLEGVNILTFAHVEKDKLEADMNVMMLEGSLSTQEVFVELRTQGTHGFIGRNNEEQSKTHSTM